MKKCLIPILLVVLAAGQTLLASDEPTLAAVKNLVATHMSGRQVRLYWTNPAISATQTVDCDVYRDGAKIYTGVLRQKDAETGGNVWTYGSSTQYFYDHAAVPGTTHEYSVVYRADGQYSFPAAVAAAVALPAVGAPAADHMGGMQVRLSVYHKLENNFPDLNIVIYRDDVKLAECGNKKEGSLDNGDNWYTTPSGYFYFYDTHAVPGRTHAYRIVFNLCEGVSIEREKSVEVKLPAVNTLTTVHTSGMKVMLEVYHKCENYFPDLDIEIYRDGEKIAECGNAREGSLENGDSWYTTSSGYFQFYDTHAIPGRTHAYRVVFKLCEGASVERDKSVEVKLPTVGVPDAYHMGGRQVRLGVSHKFENHFPDLNIEVYRDGVKLAECGNAREGSLENGDNWYTTPSGYLYFYDTHAIPDRTHAYRFAFTLCEGASIERTAEIAIAKPALNLANAWPLSGRTVRLDVSHNYRKNFPDLVFEIHRDGEKRAEFGYATDGASENGDYWTVRNFADGVSSLYFYDVHAVPGFTHEYTVVARVLGDVTNEASKSATLSRAKSIASMLTLTPRLRTVELSFERTYKDLDAMTYGIYKNGEFLAEIADGFAGELPNGDYCAVDAERQYYHDTHVAAGERNEYRVAVAYMGQELVTFSTAVSLVFAQVSSMNDVYFPVLYQLPTGEYVMMATVDMFYADAAVAEISGGGAVFADTGLSTMTITSDQLNENGRRNLQIITGPHIDLDRTAFTMKFTPVEE